MGRGHGKKSKEHSKFWQEIMSSITRELALELMKRLKGYLGDIFRGISWLDWSGMAGTGDVLVDTYISWFNDWKARVLPGEWKRVLESESESEVAQSCLTLCNPMDCSLPGSSVCGIFQARILEWVAIAFSRRSSQPRDWTRVSWIVGRRFTVWATREVPLEC